MSEFHKRLIIAGSCLLLGSLELMAEIFGLVAAR